jgi:hypothetical protein
MRQHSFSRTITLVAAAAIALAASTIARTWAQTTVAGGLKASAAGVERLEGDWIRVDQDGSGSFDALTSKFTPASLTPEARAAAGAGRRGQNAARGPAYSDDKPHAAGQTYVVVARPCDSDTAGGGGLGINPDSMAIHLVLGRDETVLAPERGGVRHIYMDGRQHPDLSRWTPTGSGHSIGRVENGELVVDTMGLLTGGVTAGGYRTPETHLIERFVVSPDGSHLTIKYRWEDAKLYQKPHEYQYELDRLPEGSYAFEKWCDASDPSEQESITPPEQQ